MTEDAIVQALARIEQNQIALLQRVDTLIAALAEEEEEEEASLTLDLEGGPVGAERDQTQSLG